MQTTSGVTCTANGLPMGGEPETLSGGTWQTSSEVVATAPSTVVTATFSHDGGGNTSCQVTYANPGGFGARAAEGILFPTEPPPGFKLPKGYAFTATGRADKKNTAAVNVLLCYHNPRTGRLTVRQVPTQIGKPSAGLWQSRNIKLRRAGTDYILLAFFFHNDGSTPQLAYVMLPTA